VVDCPVGLTLNMKCKELILKNVPSLMVVLIVAILAGGLAGVSMFFYWFNQSMVDTPVFEGLEKGSDLNPGILFASPKKVIVEQNDKITEVANSTKSGLVGIFKIKTPRTKPAPLDQYYQLNRYDGQGLVITSDGWLVSGLDIGKDKNTYIVITQDKQKLVIDQALADPTTNVFYYHVKAKDLPVKTFIDYTSVNSGDMVVAMNWRGETDVAEVLNVRQYNNPIGSTDRYNQRLILNHGLRASSTAAVVSLSGEIVAIPDKNNILVSAIQLQGAVKSLVQSQKINRPKIAIQYINYQDVAEISSLPNDLSSNQGAVILVKNDKAPFLLAGDIITQINGQYLGSNLDLNEVIQGMLPGDSASVIYWRNKEQKTANLQIQ